MLDFNGLFGATVPMYIVIGLAYISIRWLKIFSPEQCFGINLFLIDFAVPFLVLDLLAGNNPYTMNFSIVAAEVISKVAILAALVVWNYLRNNGSIEWVITFFSLAAFPNSLLIGLPIIQSLYGSDAYSLMAQVVVVQAVFWFNLQVAMYEYRAAKLLIAQQFPETAGSIASVELSPDVWSLGDQGSIEMNTEVADNGKLHLFLRNSSVSSRSSVRILETLESNIYNGSSHNSRRVADAPNEFEIIEEPRESSSSPEQTSSKSSVDKTYEGKKETPPAHVVTKLILITVWRKLIRNPTTYATIIGITWSLIAYRFNIKMPLIVKGTLSMISKTALGISMFSLGLFIGLQPKIWACSVSTLVMSTAFRYLVSPVLMAAASMAVGLRGEVFQALTLQAALPTAIISFAFARQYNVHVEIFSTSIILTTAIVLPVTIGYNVLLRLISSAWWQ